MISYCIWFILCTRNFIHICIFIITFSINIFLRIIVYFIHYCLFLHFKKKIGPPFHGEFVNTDKYNLFCENKSCKSLLQLVKYYYAHLTFPIIAVRVPREERRGAVHLESVITLESLPAPEIFRSSCAAGDTGPRDFSDTFILPRRMATRVHSTAILQALRSALYIA